MKVNKFIAIYGIAIADRREDIWEDVYKRQSRLYVCDISPKTNRVVLGSNEDPVSYTHLEQRRTYSGA